MTEPEPTLAPPRMSDDEIRKFVDDFVSQRLFSFHHVPEGEDPLTPFLVLRLAGLPEGWSPEDIGTVYEYLDKAGPRAINGMPIFFSCRFVHVEDWKRILPLIQAEAKRRKNLPIGNGDEP